MILLRPIVLYGSEKSRSTEASDIREEIPKKIIWPKL